MGRVVTQEVGVAYITLMPEMSKFNEAAQKAISKSGTFKLPDLEVPDTGGIGAKAGATFAANFVTKGSSIGSGLVSALSKSMGAVASVGVRIGQQIVSGITSAYQGVGSVMGRIGTSQVASAAKGLGINFGSSFVEGLTTAKVAIGTAVGSIVSSAVASASQSIGRAVKRSDILNNFPNIMGNLGIDKGAASSAIQELSESIEGLPTALDDITSFVTKIVPSFGGDIEKATKTAIAFNHALVAGGKDAIYQANAMEQWSQMLAAGKVDMQSFRSVLDAAPAQLQQESEYMGYGSVMDMYADMYGSESGTRPIEDLNNAFLALESQGLGKYASFAEQAAVATAGIGTAMTNVANRMAKAGAQIIDWIGQTNVSDAINKMSSGFGPAISDVTDFLDKLEAKQYLVQIGETMAQGFATFGEAMRPATDQLISIADDVLPTISALTQSLFDSIADHGSRLAGGISNFIAYVNGSLPQIQQWVADIADAFINVKFGTWEAALRMFQQVIEAVAPVLPQIMLSFGAVAQSVASFVGNISGVLAPAFAQLSELVAAVIETSRPYVERIITDLTPVFMTIAEQIGNIVTTVMPIIAQVVEQSAPMLQTIMQHVGETVVRIIDVLSPHIPKIMECIGRIVEALLPAVERIMQALEPYIEPIAEMFAGAAEKLAPAIAETVENLAPYLPEMISLVDKVVDFVAKNLPRLATTIGRIVDVVAPIIRSVIDIVSYWLPHVLNIIDIIAGALKAVWDNIIKPILDGLKGIGDWLNSLPTLDLSGLWGDGGGGGGGTPFATGGVVTQPTRAIIGEAGVPEAVVPLTARDISTFMRGVNMAGATTGEQAPTVNVVIDKVINNDTSTDIRSLGNQIGRETMLSLKAQGIAAR